MRLKKLFQFFFIGVTFLNVGFCFGLTLQDENRIFDLKQKKYLENLGKEFEAKTNFKLSVLILDSDFSVKTIQPEANELLLYTSFKEQYHFIKVGTKVQAILAEYEIHALQKEFLFSQYKIHQYANGNLALSYYLIKKIFEKKGLTLENPSPDFIYENSTNFISWIFIAFVFGTLFFLILKKHKKKSITKFCRDFKYGRFGWRC